MSFSSPPFTISLILSPGFPVAAQSLSSPQACNLEFPCATLSFIHSPATITHGIDNARIKLGSPSHSHPPCGVECVDGEGTSPESTVRYNSW